MFDAVGDDLVRFSDERKAETEIVGEEGHLPSAPEISVAEKSAPARPAIDKALALRDSGSIRPEALEEILAWRHEGHRY